MTSRKAADEQRMKCHLGHNIRFPNAHDPMCQYGHPIKKPSRKVAGGRAIVSRGCKGSPAVFDKCCPLILLSCPVKYYDDTIGEAIPVERYSGAVKKLKYRVVVRLLSMPTTRQEILKDIDDIFGKVE